MLDLGMLRDKAGEMISLKPHWWMLTDGVPAELIDALETVAPANPERVVVFIDHDTPCGSSEVAALQRKLIAFAGKHGCKLYNGRGIGYQLMIDNHVTAGEVVACCGSRAAVFSAIGALGISLSASGMMCSLEGEAISVTIPETVGIRLAGGLPADCSAMDLALHLLSRPDILPSGGILNLDMADGDLSRDQSITLCSLLSAAGVMAVTFDSEVDSRAVIDLATLRPCAAGPNTLTQLRGDTADETAIEQVFVGGCTGGRLDDLRVLADILRGHKCPKRVRLFVAPATDAIFRQAADEGIVADLLSAGALVMNQGCSVCWGRSQGYVDSEETMLTTGSYCYPGCAGDMEAQVYAASVRTAALSALHGVITRPVAEEVAL